MKKLLVVALVVMLSVAGSAFAAGYGTAGCGLGGMVIGDKPGAIQLVASFLNGICANQTFGITTGTLGCGAGIVGAKNERLNEFVVANMDNLAKDIAMGRGETLDAFAELMQVPTADRAAFYGKMQSNFAKIFTSENVVLAEVVDNVMTVTAN